MRARHHASHSSRRESVEAVTNALASLSRQRSRGVVSEPAVHRSAAVQISRLSASVHQRKARNIALAYRSSLQPAASGLLSRCPGSAARGSHAP